MGYFYLYVFDIVDDVHHLANRTNSDILPWGCTLGGRQTSKPRSKFKTGSGSMSSTVRTWKKISRS